MTCARPGISLLSPAQHVDSPAGRTSSERQAPKTIRLALEAGESVPRHSHPGEDVVLHLVEGRLELELDDERYDLAAGDLVRFAGEREVSPTAVEDSVAVIVFAPRVE